ncbi:DPP IV N-terminal domain-containing protein [Amycolatopsis sp. NPDC004079]|uniref:S9 family peptidase n=1 Tax=Amycolatopsis sp. NPDC004079 TaxID=3154549 RepID=UPI0033B75BEC
MTTTENYQTAELLLRRLARPGELIVGDRVRPQWIDGGARFWYAVNHGDSKQFFLVDPAAGTRTPDFDPTRLPAVTPPGGPLDVASPDGKVAVSQRGADLLAVSGAREWPLTSDGAPGYQYGTSPESLGNGTLLRKFGLPHLPPAVAWSPDSTKVLTHRTDEREVRETHLLEARPADGSAPTLHTQRYPYTGDEHMALAELVVLDVATGTMVRAQTEPLLAPMMSPVTAKWAWWAADGSAVYFLSQPRDRHTLALHRMDPSTGEVTTVLSETGPTRVEPNQWLYEPPIVRVLENEVLWYSQRDGWGHLYRYDLRTGELLNQVTSGDWAVRQILHVDGETVYFVASGLVAEDPYRRTVCRIGLDGTGFAKVTDDSLDHVVTMPDSRAYFVDSASTVDTPPVATVRDWSGRVLVELERADITKLAATGWTPPEPFRVKAADGITDIYGVLYRPHGFDPAKKYPVVDNIYPGPQVTRTSPSFDPGGMGMDAEPLAALGFVVLAVDGRGTPGRNKAFHDASYGKLADAGSLDDHLAAMRQLAETRPWMDLDRVGAFGHSGGGFATVRAMLDYPEVYRAGVALSGSHDPQHFSLDFVEAYDGADNPRAWAASSNVEIADRLAGKLLLVHGEMDDRVHPDNTLRLADRLIAANKDFEMLIVPGAEHVFIDCLSYVRARGWDFLVRELMGEQPPAYRPAPIVLDPELLSELFA